MFNYNIVWDTDTEPNNKIIDKIFEKISNIIPENQNWILNVVFIDEEGIKKLNNDYRKINKVTDVLSFHYFSDFKNLKDDEIAWEIVICSEKIIEQAKEYKTTKEKEFYKLLIHSILHILWYDHTEDNDYKIMSEFEKVIWQEVFEK